MLAGLQILEIGAIAVLAQRFHDHTAFGLPGKFASTFALYAGFATLWLGSCYCAAQMNSSIIVVTFVGCIVILAGALSAVLPAYGMTMACFLVFLGVFNYVGYRDIFERRTKNAPVVSVQPMVRESTHSVAP